MNPLKKPAHALPSVEPLVADKDYAELSAKRAARQSERAALKAERDVVLERIRTATIDANEEVAKISAIADGKTYQPRASDLKRLGELDRQIKDIESAIELLSEKMWRAANLASSRACEALRPQFDEIAADMVRAMIAAQTKISRYRGLLDRLTDEGFSVHHWPDVAPEFMEATNKHGRFAYWLNELCKRGIIERSQIPQELDVTR